MRFSKLAVHALALLAIHDCFPGSVKSRGLLLATAQEDGSAAIVPPPGAEKFPFEAEVHKMLDIVVNSLYQHNEVFLRELISNASDALDKLRYLSLTDPERFRSDGKDLEVQIEFDPEQQTLTIRDTGVGMTHDELVSNLGTVARSGTTKFIQALQSSGNTGATLDQIGQFGVGFYSAFLVSDRVMVASKSPNDPVQHVWESRNGAGDFLVYPDPRGNTLERGTEITLHLKDDALEYADEDRLRGLARHYSEFVVYPISLRTTSTVNVEVDDEEDDEEKVKPIEEDKKDDDDDDLEVEDETEKKEKPKKTKQVTTHSWETLNGKKAIWTREKETITEEEYQAFWHTIVGDETSKCVAHTHFLAEGNINFKSILYLPDDVPPHYRLGSIEPVAGAMRLYVRRVLISDNSELVPKYLGFIRGVVDSDDLPLNVNRETLQESKILQIIKKKVTRKAIEMIRDFAKEAEEEAEVEIDEVGNVVDKKDKKSSNRYLDWYKKFSPNIKLGLIDDEPNRGKLIKLLRFQTSKSKGKFISLDDYVENMKEWQEDIFVLGGTSAEEIEMSPFLETAFEKDVEVIYLTDAVDEYMVKQVIDYKNHKFVHLSSEGVKFKDESNDVLLRREKLYKKKFAPMISWLRKLFQGTVLRVQVVKRNLGSIPAVVSSSDFGNSANMERILKAQAFQHGVDSNAYMAMKVFEFNPRHPLILKLLEGCPPEGEGAEDFQVSQETIDAAWMIHDMAMLNGGFPIADPRAHNRRLLQYMQKQYRLESLALEPEIDAPEEEDQPPEIKKKGGMNADDFADEINIDDLLAQAKAHEQEQQQQQESKPKDDSAPPLVDPKDEDDI